MIDIDEKLMFRITPGILAVVLRPIYDATSASVAIVGATSMQDHWNRIPVWCYIKSFDSDCCGDTHYKLGALQALGVV